MAKRIGYIPPKTKKPAEKSGDKADAPAEKSAGQADK